MKKFLSLLVAFFIILNIVGIINAEKVEVAMKEEKVTIDYQIVGILTKPEGIKNAPAILMLHGFCSHKDEVGDMYKRLARELAKDGIASFRIDFRGWGESGGEMPDSTIDGQVADAEMAYGYLKKLEFVDPDRIGVVGFSLGGGIAIVSAAQNPSWYKSMVIWSSVGDFEGDFVNILSQEVFGKAAKEGIVTIDLGWRTVTLRDSFFKSLKLFDLKKEIKEYPGAFLTIAGSEDFSSAYVDTFVTNAKSDIKEAWIIEGADHIYGVLGEDQSTANSVIEKTAKWFIETL